MSFAELGVVNLDVAFFSSLFSIIVIDLVLAGDNAVVIIGCFRYHRKGTPLTRIQSEKGSDKRG